VCVSVSQYTLRLRCIRDIHFGPYREEEKEKQEVVPEEEEVIEKETFIFQVLQTY
jgi:hypothetical protein